MKEWAKEVASEPHAFPFQQDAGDGLTLFCPGITMRDYFAAKALPAILACPWSDLDLKPTSGLSPVENNARFAYEMADAMLKARKS